MGCIAGSRTSATNPKTDGMRNEQASPSDNEIKDRRGLIQPTVDGTANNRSSGSRCQRGVLVSTRQSADYRGWKPVSRCRSRDKRLRATPPSSVMPADPFLEPWFCHVPGRGDIEDYARTSCLIGCRRDVWLVVCCCYIGFPHGLLWAEGRRLTRAVFDSPVRE